MEYKDAANCLVVRDGRILMLTHRRDGREYKGIPGGAIEEGETPEQAAIRELAEECNVQGTIMKKLCEYNWPMTKKGLTIHSYYVDIGDQTPTLGHDPDDEDECQTLIGLQWMAFDEICERDRMFLVSHGIMGVKEFFDGIQSWGDDISYPNTNKKRGD